MFRKCFAIVVLLALSATAGASATPVLDQQQTTLVTDRVATVGGSGNQVLAQIVVSGVAGRLAEVDLPVGCVPQSSSFLLEIREAVVQPQDVVLASQTVSGLALGPEWKSILLVNPPFIPADTPFAIVASAPGNGCGLFGAPQGQDPYPRGSSWYQGPPNPSATWAGPFAEDYGFKTFVEASCQVPLIAHASAKGAATALAKYGCSAGSVTGARSTAVSMGDVISQSQPAGTALAAGAAVDYVVSLGLPLCVVPRVVGKTLDSVRAAIAKANCRGAPRNDSAARRASRHP